MALFQIFLKSAADWAVGTVLDTVVSCFRCREKQDASIPNKHWETQECRNCHAINNQFVNACDFTVTPATGLIGCAEIGIDRRQYQWTNWKGKERGIAAKVFRTSRFLHLPYQASVLGLRDRSIVVRLIVKRYDDDSNITSSLGVLHPDADSFTVSTYWHWRKGHRILIPDTDLLWAPHNIPLKAHIDFLTEDKELITRHTRVISPWPKE